MFYGPYQRLIKAKVTLNFPHSLGTDMLTFFSSMVAFQFVIQYLACQTLFELKVLRPAVISACFVRHTNSVAIFGRTVPNLDAFTVV